MTITTTTNDHSDLSVATETEVPGQLLHIRDMIWDGLPDDEKESFSAAFDGALAACKDKAYVWQRFMIWLLRDEMALFNRNVIDRVAVLYERWVGGNRPSEESFRSLVTVANDARVATEGKFPLHNYYVVSTAMFAARAAYNPYSAARSVLDGAMSRRRLVRGKKQQSQEEYKSFQRQRDALLMLLANS